MVPMPDLADLKNSLTNKIGPLPAWAWAAIPAGMYVAYSYYKARNDTTPVDSADQPLDTTDTADYGLNTGGSYLPGYGSAPDGSSNLPTTPAPTDSNLKWAQRAINYLVGIGVTGTDAVTAINAYVYGYPTTVTQTQFTALQKAIKQYGALPEGGGTIPTVATSPAPTPPPKPPPPTVIKVPEAPTTVSLNQTGSATATTATLKAGWGVPQSNGGSAILGYSLTLFVQVSGAWKGVSSTLTLPNARSYEFVRLGKNHTYKVEVKARNVKGWGPAAAKTIAVPK